jgi:ATP-dependent Clp protease protease subunit
VTADDSRDGTVAHPNRPRPAAGAEWLPFDVPTGAIGMGDADGAREFMTRQLLDRRVVLLSGRLDHDAANRVGAALMTLDATGDEPVDLRVDSGDGTVDAALALVDVVDLLGVPVHGHGVGRVAGPALGVLAVTHRRTISPHGSLLLVEPSVEFRGSARQLEQSAAAHLDRWEAWCRRLSEATGQPMDRISEDAARGRRFSADEAVAYGLVDDVVRPEARLYRLSDRPFGFAPG